MGRGDVRRMGTAIRLPAPRDTGAAREKHTDGGLNEQWREVGRRVFVRRHRLFDINSGLILGTDRCLVVDTLSTAAQARELIAAIRSLTSLPWLIVNTHAHFDHCFGNANFVPAPILAHVRCAARLSESAGEQRRIAAGMAPELAAEFAAVTVVPPDRTFERRQVVDLGGRTVTVLHPGRGHTDHDVVVHVPDAAVLFTGDLVEQGGPPNFEDSYPLDWPGTAAALLPLATGAVVPGHGDVVDRDFVECQAGDLQSVADRALGRDVPLPDFGAQTPIALRRAAWQLATRPRRA